MADAGASAGAPPARRTRVAIQVDFSSGWFGGLNYFRCLVEAANELPGRPLEFVVLTGTRVDAALRDGFPVREVVSHRMFDRHSLPWYLRKLQQKFRHRDPALARLLRALRVDVLSHSGYLGVHSRLPAISWIPDLQHLHLPAYFRRWDIMRRNAEIRRMLAASQRVIVSSRSALADVQSIEPGLAGKVDVLRFPGSAPAAGTASTLAELRARHGIPERYFFLPNQYWKHKNHLAVIRALGRLARDGVRPTVVSTGSLDDYRNPGFFDEVRRCVDEEGVDANYRILGVVPYGDVLGLMRHCDCVINPSRFEGWSTTVEEAKAAGKPLLLSDIAVHREQAPDKARFFGTDDIDTLATLMRERWLQPASAAGDDDAERARADYQRRRDEFAHRYAAIVQGVLPG